MNPKMFSKMSNFFTKLRNLPEMNEQFSYIFCTFFKISQKLDLMFMKHYAPNRCLYIKVAKLRIGVGSAETSNLQNCSVKLFKEHLKVDICKGRLFEKNDFFSNFHQFISSSSSIS